jgi:hypothetical protein
MTARATRRISQPDSYHSAPNRSATTRATYSIAISHSDYRLRSSTRASTAARLRSRPESERPVGAFPHRLRGVIRASPRRVGGPRPAERKPTKDNSNGFESSEVNRRYRD